MIFVHECGHVLWGVAQGGTFAYMKIAFFEIYPRFAVTTRFCLGLVGVSGLQGFDYCLFLLGGSLTTNIVSWLLLAILLRTQLGHKTWVALKIASFLGLLDLPLYVILPQVGLRHWVFFGGLSPEPLLGARLMGVPDSFFYATVFFTTFLGALACVLASVSEVAFGFSRRVKNSLSGPTRARYAMR